MENLKSNLEHDLDENRFDEAITRAWVDEEYRQRLLANPKKALREVGVLIPKGVKVTVHEFDINDRHIFLPPRMITPTALAAENVQELNRPQSVKQLKPRNKNIPLYSVARVFLKESKAERS